MNKKSTPVLGPNLYLTSPGAFTQLHQDGHGTVDSGHFNMCGYNEVVMLRRLTERHKIEACKLMRYPTGLTASATRYDPVNGLPHDEAEVSVILCCIVRQCMFMRF
jgi:hypothetical protein